MNSTLTSKTHPGKPDIASRRRGGTWRIIRTEVRRGSAPTMLVAVAGAGLLMLMTRHEPWVGQWYGLAAEWRSYVPAMAPIAATLGAWQGGRDQRRRMTELLGTTPRGPVLARVLSWAIVAAAAGMGSLAAWAAAAVVVAPIATYTGTWWWTVVGGVVIVTAFAFTGAALGSLSASRLQVPLVGVGALVVVTAMGRPELAWWGPVLLDVLRPGEYVTGAVTALQVMWFGGLVAVVVLAIVGFGRRLAIAAAVAAAVAVAGGIGLAVVPDRTTIDDDAATLVCAGSEPEFCVPRQLAFLLETVGPVVAAETATTWDRIVDMPERVVVVPELGATWPPPNGVHEIRIDGLLNTSGRLADGGRYGVATELAYAITIVTPGPECADDRPDAGAEAVHGAAAGWGNHLVDPEAAEDSVHGAAIAPYRRLVALPDDAQIAWINRYRTAVSECDGNELRALGQELAS